MIKLGACHLLLESKEVCRLVVRLILKRANLIAQTLLLQGHKSFLVYAPNLVRSGDLTCTCNSSIQVLGEVLVFMHLYVK